MIPGDLPRRVARNHISADEITRCGRLDENAIGVAANAVVLDHVTAAVADQADTEVVIAVGNRTVAAEQIPSNAIVVTVDVAVATTEGRTRVVRVSDRDAVFDDAVRHGIEEYAAEAVVVRRDASHRGVGADVGRSDDEDSRSEERRVGKECRSRGSAYH